MSNCDQTLPQQTNRGRSSGSRGLVEYNRKLRAACLDSGMRTHSSLLNVVLHDYVRSHEIAGPDIGRFDPAMLSLGMWVL